MAYAKKRNLRDWKSDVDTKKIDGMALSTYSIAMANLFLQDKYRKYYFFQITFLLINTNIKIVLNMTVFLLFNAVVKFIKEDLRWRSYITVKNLSTKKELDL